MIDIPLGQSRKQPRNASTQGLCRVGVVFTQKGLIVSPAHKPAREEGLSQLSRRSE